MSEGKLFVSVVCSVAILFLYLGGCAAASGGRARGISSTLLKRLALFPRAGQAQSISEHLLAGLVAGASPASEASPRSPSLCGYRGPSLLV